MSPNEYQKDALVLENKDHESVKLRLNPVILSLFKEQLETLILASRRLDVIKKALFYGKGHAELSAMEAQQSVFAQNMQTQLINDNLLRRLHSILGLCTESGELSAMLLGVLCNGENFDTETLRISETKIFSDVDWAKEAGDILWYVALLSDTITMDLEPVMRLNIDKLRKRYPNKFEEKKSAKSRFTLR